MTLSRVYVKQIVRLTMSELAFPQGTQNYMDSLPFVFHADASSLTFVRITSRTDLWGLPETQALNGLRALHGGSIHPRALHQKG
jgi:hypothetical protein